MGLFFKTKSSDDRCKTKVELMFALMLIIGTLGIYSQARHHDFVVYDDRIYITENPYVSNGLTPQSLRWAFSFAGKEKTYWHPLTWLSHMLDVQIFGMHAGRHVLVNVLLHAVNALLLLHVLRRMTDDLWPSAIVALLFVLHPLNVESVAWVAARKNVLSTTFWMLTVLTYLRYVEKPALGRYAAVLVLFSLGLLSKPMLVTLPCVLLLLDFWPLRRHRIGSPTDLDKPKAALSRLLIEKIPMLLLSAASVILSTFSLFHYGDLVSTDSVDLRLRLANALVSYVIYLVKMTVPLNLTCFYPFPVEVPLWQSAGSLVVLAGLTVAAIRLFRKYPFFLIGWLWYLGTLFPVIGLMQAGMWPAVADRFVYIPQIGIFIAVAWGAAALLERSRRHIFWIVPSAGTLLLVFVGLSYNQVGYWRNSIALFTHAIKVTRDNYLSHYALGYAYDQEGRVDDAMRQYELALTINPNEIDVHYNLALLLSTRGRFEEAVRHYERVLQIKPDDAQAHNNIGNIYFRQKKWNEAIGHYKNAIRVRPEYAKAYGNLGAAMLQSGRLPEAVQYFNEALRIMPKDKDARRYLHLALAELAEEKKLSNPVAKP